MLAKVGSFIFDINNKDIQSIAHQLSFGWNRQSRLGNHNYTQKSGKFEESISFSGKLILKSVSTLKAFEDMAKEQKPQRLTLGTGESYKITIDSISRTKSGFLKDGKFRYQEYSISMQRYFQ
jgi:phage protein U